MFFDRRRLVLLVPSPTVTPAAEQQLREAPTDALADLVLNRAEPWWRRRACIGGLAGRVPDARAAALLGLVRDPELESELRAALLEVLATPGRAHAGTLLEWLQAQEGVEQPYNLDVAVLRARAALGDVAAAPRIAELAANDWSHRRTAGETALDLLIQNHGLKAVLDVFGAPALEALAFQGGRAEAERLLGVRLLHRAGGDVKPALADRSVIVAHQAHLLLAATRGDDEALFELVRARGPGALWALVVLHRRGHPVEAQWQALGAPKIVLPTVPPDVRRAILREYAPGERQTDPRWLLEVACTPPFPREDAQEILARAGAALAAAGLDPAAPISAGDLRQQGDGTFSSIDTSAGPVMVSSLGPFFSIEQAGGPARRALEAADFRIIDGALAVTRFEGLHVYFFGDREPLAVHDLLFYWQD